MGSPEIWIAHFLSKLKYKSEYLLVENNEHNEIIINGYIRYKKENESGMKIIAFHRSLENWIS